MNFVKVLRTPFFTEELRWVLLDREHSTGNIVLFSTNQIADIMYVSNKKRFLIFIEKCIIFCCYVQSKTLIDLYTVSLAQDTFTFNCSSNVTTTVESLTKRHVIIKFSNIFVLIKYSHAQIFPFGSSKMKFLSK